MSNCTVISPFKHRKLRSGTKKLPNPTKPTDLNRSSETITMRAHTLVIILLGDDPSPLKVLVERLVQQLQTTPPIPGETITNLAHKIQRDNKKQNSQIATGSLRLPGRRRGSERAAPRPGAAAARALPSSSLSRSPRAGGSFSKPSN